MPIRSFYIDPNDPRQNEFVQEWLEAYRAKHGGATVLRSDALPEEVDAFDLVAEAVQETYSPPAEMRYVQRAVWEVAFASGDRRTVLAESAADAMCVAQGYQQWNSGSDLTAGDLVVVRVERQRPVVEEQSGEVSTNGER